MVCCYKCAAIVHCHIRPFRISRRRSHLQREILFSPSSHLCRSLFTDLFPTHRYARCIIFAVVPAYVYNVYSNSSIGLIVAMK